jgi:hypothetical protein
MCPVNASGLTPTMNRRRSEKLRTQAKPGEWHFNTPAAGNTIGTIKGYWFTLR